ncbi:TPA: hypothetical protein EYN65_24975 [Candidatus Poribacteria bacterium]|nr:hypothetical protein [Candidatus Poribacteria bacterium]
MILSQQTRLHLSVNGFIFSCFFLSLSFEAQGLTDLETNYADLVPQYQVKLTDTLTRIDLRLAKTYLQIEGFQLVVDQYQQILEMAFSGKSSFSWQ